MSNKADHIKQYNNWLESRISAGLPAIERSIVNIGQSYVFASGDGIRVLEWSEIEDPTRWDSKQQQGENQC